ncbi:MAG: spore germination protein, partial [Bacillota bacterium]
EKGLDAILDAQGLLLLDGSTSAIGIGIKKLEIRSISESVTEPVVVGPRDGFIEDLGVNLTLLRRRLKTPSLKVEKYQLGRLSKTDVAIVYLETVTNKKLVEEVKNRLLGIDLDGILASNYLAEYMEDSPWSPFPQLDVSDRPDWVAANLLEGKVAIMIDNAAFTLLVPVVYTQFLHAAEDFYIRYIYASFTRIVRFVAVNIALLLPSFYIAIVTFHQELLPTDLLLSIAAGREPVPFPAFVEALMMEATFEILREAGVRMPRPVGQATSIVGALVIGNAAVSAGLVSPVMVIVVALTALASFVIPSQPAAFSIRILRFPIMFLAAGLGFYGVMLGIMAILIHLSSLRSFGIPYLSPFAPLMLGDFKNAFIRTPWWMLVNRAGYYDLQNSKRQRRGQKPKKPSREGGEER